MATKARQLNLFDYSLTKFLMCTLPYNIFYGNIKLCTYFKNILPLFAVFDFFTAFKTYEKLSIICRMNESEGAWVYC